ncbi:SURF1 family protein [Vibrio sagamiensis]|uniref:SURF1-like protein n=1 Tax=Vibrio sagamiensis NBRC 104589 TaxID=1219064 RepID=A0A511QGW5_9VIBR|nr:SURF1 family protein [Vibrio sagamiensis]PNQ66802.1 SURF1 family protein [Vibrio agarivorans]GEM76554.1 SURF1-like protein [Vibrio sagamiensis NBRC 104589]
MKSPSSLLGLSASFWAAVCLTVAVFLALVKLGIWQLDRGNEKWALEKAMEQKRKAPHQDIAILLSYSESKNRFQGFKVQAQVLPQEFPIILLDNQTYAGKVGYLAYQIVAINAVNLPFNQAFVNTPLVLLELGFVEGLVSRTALPKVIELEEGQLITGRTYQKSNNPLSSDLMAEKGNPVRIQNLNIEQLAESFNIDLVPFVIQPDNLKSWPYSFPWNPLPMTSEKHFGYSFQWFVMAGVFLLITLMVLFRWIRSVRSQGGEA